MNTSSKLPDNGNFLNWLAEKGFTLEDAKRLFELVNGENLTQNALTNINEVQ